MRRLTVLVDGVPTRACVTPLESVDGAEITTVEGLACEGWDRDQAVPPDRTLPGMLHGRVLRPPAHGAWPQSPNVSVAAAAQTSSTCGDCRPCRPFWRADGQSSEHTCISG